MRMKEELREGAERILTTLDKDDVPAAYLEVRKLMHARDINLYEEVGRITRGLHDALRSFSTDAARSLGRPSAEDESPRSRLRYVTELTANAANRTMDLVDSTEPHAQRLSANANALVEFLDDPELNLEHIRRYCRDSAAGIQQDSSEILGNLQQIVLAQDFQDLSGQIIHRVIGLLQTLEDELVDLVARCAAIEQVTGVFIDETEDALGDEVDPIAAEGPAMNKEARDDVVSNQDDVDNLLSSLGF